MLPVLPEGEMCMNNYISEQTVCLYTTNITKVLVEVRGSTGQAIREACNEKPC